MKHAHKFLGSASVVVRSRVQEIASRQLDTDVKRTLRRRPDGTLEFMNGSPVRAHELMPGETYNIILTGEKK